MFVYMCVCGWMDVCVCDLVSDLNPELIHFKSIVLLNISFTSKNGYYNIPRGKLYLMVTILYTTICSSSVIKRLPVYNIVT